MIQRGETCDMEKILITGALGQIGSELLVALREAYGDEQVIGSDIRTPEDQQHDGLFEQVDVTDATCLYEVAKKHKVDTIIHLASLLSATAEKNPKQAWDLNMGGLVNGLEVAKELDLKLFIPSSIAAFGQTTPKINTPQDTFQRPTTMYGVNKVAGELLCDYYFHRYGVDTRGIRFPGLISYVTPPGGGTTDYAVEIYYAAVQHGMYTSFIDQHTYMDMMYMPDALRAIHELMEANPDQLIHRNAFNITAMSCTPECIATEIQKHIPSFTIDYEVDPVRQKIADSWPNNLDASAAKEEWGYEPQYNLASMTDDMLAHIRGKSAIS